jgi:hypothetical protein
MSDIQHHPECSISKWGRREPCTCPPIPYADHVAAVAEARAEGFANGSSSVEAGTAYLAGERDTITRYDETMGNFYAAAFADGQRDALAAAVAEAEQRGYERGRSEFTPYDPVPEGFIFDEGYERALAAAVAAVEALPHAVSRVDGLALVSYSEVIAAIKGVSDARNA